MFYLLRKHLRLPYLIVFLIWPCIQASLIPSIPSPPSWLISAKQESNGNNTTPCNKLDRFSDRESCFEEVLLTYYRSEDSNILFECPNIGVFFATSNCNGCPWDGISNPQNATFTSAEPSCAVSQFLPRPSLGQHALWVRVYYPMVFAGILFSVIPIFLDAFGSEERFSFRVQYHGWREPAILFTVFLVFDVVRILLLVPSTVMEVCETRIGLSLHRSATTATYLFLLIFVLTRYLRLPSSRLPGADSWLIYMNAKKKTIKGMVSIFLLLIFTIGVIATAFLDLLPRNSTNIQQITCFLGSSGGTTYGILQYTKLCLELLAVVVYSFGPQVVSLRWILRMTLLLIIFISSVAVAIFQHFVHDVRASTLIPRVLDRGVAFAYLELGHALFVCALGLLEPIRHGFPILCGTRKMDKPAKPMKSPDSSTNSFMESFEQHTNVNTAMTIADENSSTIVDVL